MPSRTQVEEDEKKRLWHALYMGMCIGGHVKEDRTRGRSKLHFGAQLRPFRFQSTKTILVLGHAKHDGAAAKGDDTLTYNAIRTSKHWQGTIKDLDDLVDQHMLNARVQLIREAIDCDFFERSLLR